MLKNSLQQFIKEQSPFCAIYLIGNNWPVNLEFKTLDIHNNRLFYTNKTINDDYFFINNIKLLNKGKNDFLFYIHKNIAQKETYKINSQLNLIVTIPSLYWFE